MKTYSVSVAVEVLVIDNIEATDGEEAIQKVLKVLGEKATR